MPIYQLGPRCVFPPVGLSEPDGLLAIGGDLRPKRLLAAYAAGIFPWYNEEDPPLWWSPDPRFVLWPGDLRVTDSLRRVIRNGPFRVTLDRDFEGVISQCRSTPRKGQDGTWITPEIREAYARLHAQGYAHSVEVWNGERLAGGLYGVSLGSAFFGESMFALESNASKVGFVRLVETLAARGFTLVDCQVHTEHLERFGAKPIPRAQFLLALTSALKSPTQKGSWGDWPLT